MLHKLLLREWILVRRALLMIVGIYLVFEAYFVCRASSPREYFIFASIYAAFLTLPLFLREDKFRATSWSCTMPVCRQDLVRARFLGAWLLVAGNLALALVLAVIMPASRVQVAAVFDPATLFLTAAVVTIALGLMLPFAIRFGALGVMIFLVVFQIAGSVVLLVAVRAGGTSRASQGILAGGSAALTDGLEAIRDLLSPPAFYLAAAAVLILINWLGYRLAAALFRRREL